MSRLTYGLRSRLTSRSQASEGEIRVSKQNPLRMAAAAICLAAPLMIAGCSLWPFGGREETDAAIPRELPPPPPAPKPAPNVLGLAMDCVRKENGALLAAHRARINSLDKENSLSAMFAAHRAGIPVLEIDINRTKDNFLVLMHDDRVDRTTDGTGRVADLTLAEFRNLRLDPVAADGMGEAPPSFEQALAWANGRAILELDRKQPAQWWDILTAVRRAGAIDRVIAISYSPEEALEIVRIDPSVMISARLRTISDLAALENAGISSDRIFAWTGTAGPDPVLWKALAAKGVETAFGTLGRPGDSLDSAFLADGNPAEYADLLASGVTLIVSDEALRVAPAFGGRLAAGRQCLAGLVR